MSDMPRLIRLTYLPSICSRVLVQHTSERLICMLDALGTLDFSIYVQIAPFFLVVHRHCIVQPYCIYFPLLLSYSLISCFGIELALSVLNVGDPPESPPNPFGRPWKNIEIRQRLGSFRPVGEGGNLLSRAYRLLGSRDSHPGRHLTRPPPPISGHIVSLLYLAHIISYLYSDNISLIYSVLI